MHVMVLAAVLWLPVASRRRFASRGPTNVVRIEASLSEDAVVPVEVLPTPLETDSSGERLKSEAERPLALLELLPSAFRERPGDLPIDRQVDSAAEVDSKEAARHERSQTERLIPPPTSLPADGGANGKAARVVRRAFDAMPPAVQPQQDTPRERKMKRPTPTVMASVVARPAELAGFEDQPNADFSSNPPPPYPSRAISQGWEGVVLLQVEVDTAGRVTKVEVLESSGYMILDAAAMEAVGRWRGEPAKRWGRAVASTERLPIRFRL